jgi:hypothetical protein
MALSEKIQEHVEKLPASLQAEVLDFVEYLVAKAERDTARPGRKSWSDFSLSSAMRGMEEEDRSMYRETDLKVLFS